MNPLPITSRLLPNSARNLAYLAEIAALTRLTTGALRVNENSPHKQHDPRLTMNQKRQAFWERFFVEIIGTLGTILALHAGQDVTSKFFEATTKMRFIPKEAVEKGILTAEERVAANQAIQRVFGDKPKGLVQRVLYSNPMEMGEKKVQRKASMSTLREVMHDVMGSPEAGEALFAKTRGFVDDFARHLNRVGAATIIGGVACSALFGGFATQWINDRLFAPFLKTALKKRYGDDILDQKALAHTAPQPVSYRPNLSRLPIARPIQAQAIAQFSAAPPPNVMATYPQAPAVPSAMPVQAQVPGGAS